MNITLTLLELPNQVSVDFYAFEITNPRLAHLSVQVINKDSSLSNFLLCQLATRFLLFLQVSPLHSRQKEERAKG